MASYSDALEMVLENVRPMGVEEKPLLRSAGQVLWEDVHSDIRLPQADISGPDGYAVRSADIRGASRSNPVTLKITGTLRAGYMPRRKVVFGTAVRIMTGSVVPDGADCVVRFEDTDEPGNKNGPNPDSPSKVKIYVELPPRANIRPSGANVKKGALVLRKGVLIGPTQISALSSIGRAKVGVVRRPVIAVIATGDELVSSGKLPLAKSYNSNAGAVASLIAHYGGIPKIMGIARDRESSLREKIGDAVSGADAVITSGGVSKGDYDLVRLFLEKTGSVLFSTIRMGPGGAVAFGTIERPSGKNVESVPIFCLSGPPQGCLINCETLVRPALLKMRGLTRLAHPSVEATALDSIPNKMSMAFVKFTQLVETEGGYEVMLNLSEKVGILASLALANSFTIIPEGTIIKPGDRVQVLPLDWRT